jgi:glutaredoxin
MVVIYTLEGCSYCKELKKRLRQELISYREIDADENYKQIQKLEDYLETKSYPIIHIKKINKDIFIIGAEEASYRDNVIHYTTIEQAVHLILQNI